MLAVAVVVLLPVTLKFNPGGREPEDTDQLLVADPSIPSATNGIVP